MTTETDIRAKAGDYVRSHGITGEAALVARSAYIAGFKAAEEDT